MSEKEGQACTVMMGYFIFKYHDVVLSILVNRICKFKFKYNNVIFEGCTFAHPPYNSYYCMIMCFLCHTHTHLGVKNNMEWCNDIVMV